MDSRPAPLDPAARDPYADPMTATQILFSFQGRVPRRTWWLWGFLLLLVVNLLGVLVLGIAGVPEEVANGVMSLLILWPALAVSVKRWHDRDKSGWWVLINFIPFVGVVWALVENGFLRGTPGPNRFGEDLSGRL